MKKHCSGPTGAARLIRALAHRAGGSSIGFVRLSSIAVCFVRGSVSSAMTSSIDTFEQAARLDSTALRQLLDSDRPEQRVWAIWALALRHKNVVELAARATTEPTPGVRRALAVILAGHGETDLLVAMARRDPDLTVRASAMQLVTRLAIGGAIDHAVVGEAARREPEIQLAILAALDDRAPAFFLDLAGELMEHGGPSVCLEAFEVLIRANTQASVARAVAWLRALQGPFAPEARRRWRRWQTDHRSDRDHG